MDDETKRFSMIYGEYDEALDKKAAEALLKEEPGWSDEKIARIVKDISSEQVSSFRKGMKLI